MPGLVIDGVQVPVPELDVKNWHDDPRLRLRIGEKGQHNDGRARRTRWIRSIVLHTTKGIPGGRDRRPQKILPGVGPTGSRAEAVASYWSTSDLASGAHLVCDFDGSWVCLADLATECAYHATTMNDVSIGIEIYQGADAEVYDGQLDSVVAMVDFLTARFGIQRQVPDKYRGPIPRLVEGGADCVGVFGHRDQTHRRGEGDPGDAVMAKLVAAGYERFDFSGGEDLGAWKERQRAITAARGATVTIDGVPGPRTIQSLEAAGYEDGLWRSGAVRAELRLRQDLHLLESRYRDDLPGDRLRAVVRDWAR
jgi:hypothetical protein